MEMNLNKLSEIERSDWSELYLRKEMRTTSHQKAIVLTVQC